MNFCGLSSTGLNNIDANNITSDNITVYSNLNVSGFSNLNELLVRVGRLSEMQTVILRGVGAGQVSSSCTSGPVRPAQARSLQLRPRAPSGPDLGRPGPRAGLARGARDSTGRPKGESQQEFSPPAGLESHADVSRPGLL
jgi:hypothetical protein